MAKDAFLFNLRAAAGFLSPTAQVDGIRLDPDHLADVLRGATIWLTPRSVEGFDPSDYPELPPEERARLGRDVDAFRAIAAQVPPDAPASRQQVQEALPAFISILTTMWPYLEGFNVYHALKRDPFPDYVRDFAVRVGEDSTGDPAAWVWVVIDDEVAGHDLIARFHEIRERVTAALRRSGIDLYPYISFRTESEQLELESSPAP